MILVVAGTFFVKWPSLPTDVPSIAGAACYICDSRPFHDIVYINTMIRKEEREKILDKHRVGYILRETTGTSGMVRASIDMVALLLMLERMYG